MMYFVSWNSLELVHNFTVKPPAAEAHALQLATLPGSKLDCAYDRGVWMSQQELNLKEQH